MNKSERTANLANEVLKLLQKHVDLDEILSGHSGASALEVSIAITGLTSVIGRVTALAIIQGNNAGTITTEQEIDQIYNNVHDQLETSMMAEIETMKKTVKNVGKETDLNDIERALMDMKVENKNKH